MAANNHPLMITEIVAMVFDHLQIFHGTSSLFACAQVSRLWAEEAIPRIWSEGNCWGHEVKYLLRVPNYRRQSYANHMRSINDLWFKSLKYYHSILLAPLRFPRLRSASFLIPYHRDEIFRLQYLVPSLQKLEIYEHGWEHDEYRNSDYGDFDYVSDDFFLQIQVSNSCADLMLGIMSCHTEFYFRNVAQTWKNSKLRGHRIMLMRNRY